MRSPTRTRGGWLACLAALVTTLACSPTRSRLVVYAASSLTEVMEDLESGFERDHQDVDVVVSLAGSQILSHQIAQGAPADVFVTADAHYAQTLHANAYLEVPVDIATNRLVLISPAGSDGPRSLDALAATSRLVLGDEHVPIGRYTRQALMRAGGTDLRDRVLARVVSFEPSVRLVRSRVLLGEANAGVVYASDAHGQPALDATPLPASLRVQATLQAGIVRRRHAHPRAAAFVESLTTQSSLRVFARHGLGPPERAR